jgi:hypothetical protein
MTLTVYGLQLSMCYPFTVNGELLTANGATEGSVL